MGLEALARGISRANIGLKALNRRTSSRAKNREARRRKASYKVYIGCQNFRYATLKRNRLRLISGFRNLLKSAKLNLIVV